MKAPIRDLSKAEILTIHEWRCRHGHTGLVHYNCWRSAQGEPERVGFLDIETSNLDADFGIIFSWCIQDEQGQIVHDIMTKRDLRRRQLDMRVVETCLQEMKKYDRLVGHYSERFDFPFIRSRALYWGLDSLVPRYGDIVQTDTWRMAKTLLKISSNRQENIARLLLGATGGEPLKTRIDSRHWLSALQGDKEALDYILDHNIRDVKELKNNYDRLKAFARQSGKSL